MPGWALILGVGVFPLVNSVVEEMTYNGYAYPRVEAHSHPAFAVALVTSVFSLQHIAVPFAFDIQFLVWRVLSFVPLLLFWVFRTDGFVVWPAVIVTHWFMDVFALASLLFMPPIPGSAERSTGRFRRPRCGSAPRRVACATPRCSWATASSERPDRVEAYRLGPPDRRAVHVEGSVFLDWRERSYGGPMGIGDHVAGPSRGPRSRAELLARWVEAFPGWVVALSTDDAVVLESEGHLPFAREEVFWSQVCTLVGYLIRAPGEAERIMATEAAVLERVLDVFAPVCTAGGVPTLRRRLGGLNLAQRRAVAALMDAVTEADWIRAPWREAARLEGEDWVERVTPVDEGRLVWWWRKEKQMAEDGLAATPVTTAVRRDLSQLAMRIEAAFRGVPAPGHVTLACAQRRAVDADDDVVAHSDEPHRGRWQDVPLSELAACPQASSYLEADGLHYYAPRLMLEVLRWRECSNRDLLPICDVFILRAERHPTEFSREHDERFTAEQLEVIAAFARAGD